MRHPKAVEWEDRLRRVFDRIDDYLEDKYGDRYPLHPARPPRGATASKAQSGLFNVGGSFSAGYGTRLGPGYVVEVRMVTLAQVPAELRDHIEAEVAGLLRRELPWVFPGRELRVDHDGNLYKIYGDLSLGTA